MKAVSGALIAVLVVLLVVAYLFFSGMIPLSNNSVGTSTITYSNDVISISNKFISITQPISGTTTSIQFTIQNNGDKTVNDVDVSFYNLAGFSAISLDCGNNAIEISNTECKFDIASLFSRKITAILTAATVASPTPTQIYYKITYPYSGWRIAMIPVLGKTVDDLPSGVSFQQPPGTVGPVQTTIQPPVGATVQKNGQTIVENFAREGLPFSISFSIQNTNPTNQLILPKQNILSVKNAIIQGCDKLDKDGNLLANQTLPFTVQCSLIPTQQGIPLYDFVTLNVSYNYNYTLQYVDSFTIVPASNTKS